MSPLIVVTLLLALCSAQDFSISNCTFIAPVCDQPENCGGSPPGFGCNCAQCGSCVQSRNPLFRAECKANVVLILDEYVWRREARFVLGILYFFLPMFCFLTGDQVGFHSSR